MEFVQRTWSLVKFILRLTRDVHEDCRVLKDCRIVGGTEVVPNSIPYQASLKLLRRGRAPYHFCGGVVVSEDHILTAAHCCDVSFHSSVTVSKQKHDFTKLSEGRSQHKFLILCT